MGLEAPLALLGLAGALLPILAHRIRRRDLTPVALPTMALLQRAEAAKKRSRGLTDILLLLVRIAILAVACLAISAPYVTARLTFGDGTIASAAIVVDDSLSMMRREADVPLLSLAIERAHAAIDSLPAGSEIALVAAGAPARVLTRRTDDLQAAHLALDELGAPTVRGNALPGAITLAAQQLASARNPNRRLLVLSDFAEHTGIANEDLALDGVSVTLERLGSVPAPPNVYFSAVSALADPTTQGQTSISIELATTGDLAQRVPVSVHGGGKQIARAEIAVAEGRGRTVLHVPTPDELADPTATLRIESDDSLPEDNTAGVLLRRTDALQVMVVNGDPHPASRKDELHYALNALRLSPLPMSLRSVDASALSRHDLSRIDVVVLANVPAPGPELAARLVDFVRSGGGLIVTAGDHVVARRYNAALGEALPARIRARAAGKPVTVELANDETAPDGAAGLQNVEVRQRLVVDSDADAWLHFSDGLPALLSADIERGRSALLATTLDADWSDLPFRPGYLPLLTRLVRDVARAHNLISGPVPAGQSVTLGVPPGAQRLEVIGPDGAHRLYEGVQDQASVEFERTEQPGPYRVMAASDRGALTDVPRGAFVVTTPVQESDLTAAPEMQGTSAQIAARSADVRVHRSIAPYLFLLCGLFVLAEGALRLRVR